MLKMRHEDKHEALRALATFLIIFIALCVFALFYIQKEELFMSNTIQKFLLLVIAGFGLLIFLGFLVHKDSPKLASKKKKRK